MSATATGMVITWLVGAFLHGFKQKEERVQLHLEVRKLEHTEPALPWPSGGGAGRSSVVRFSTVRCRPRLCK